MRQAPGGPTDQGKDGGARSRWLWPALLFCCVVYTADIPLRDIFNHTQGTDFKSFYLAFKAASLNQDLYDARILNQLAPSFGLNNDAWPYLYPPVFAYVLTPLSIPGYQTAQTIWGLGSILLFSVLMTANILTAQRMLESQGPGAGVMAGGNAIAGLERGRVAGESEKGDQRSRLFRALLFFSLLFLPLLPLRNNLHMGQVNILVMTAIVLSLLAYARRSDALSGVLLSLAIVIKVTPAILLGYYLVRGRFRIVIAALASVAAWIAITLAMGARPAWIRFLEVLPSMSHGQQISGLFAADNLANFSLAGLLARLLEGDPHLVKLCAVGLLTPMAVIALGAAARARHEALAYLGLSALMPFMIFASPLAYIHHVLYLYPSFVGLCAWLWTCTPTEQRLSRLLPVLALLAMASANWASIYERLQVDGAGHKILTSMNLYGLLLLYIVGLLSPRTAGHTGKGWTKSGHAEPPGEPDLARVSPSIHLP